MAGEGEADGVERLGPLVRDGGVVPAGQLSHRDRQHVGDSLQHRHPVDRPDAALDLGDPVFRTGRPGRANPTWDRPSRLRW